MSEVQASGKIVQCIGAVVDGLPPGEAIDMESRDFLKTLQRGDVVIKGANAVDTEGNAGVLVGNETGGTIGAASITVTVVGTTASGSSITKTGTITNGSEVGAKFDVGIGTDRYVDVTSVTITGGTTGDAFQIQTKLDR